MSRVLALAVLLVAGRPAWQEGESTPDLRTRVEAALADGLSADELQALADEGLREAEQAASRSGLWSALGLVAELCRAGPAAEARALRARALGLLARHDSDSLRWSTLLTRAFLPPFERLPSAVWTQELEAYERRLEELSGAAANDRVRAELLYARAFARVFLERRRDWLGEAGRSVALEQLDELQRRFGALSLPGAADPALETVGRRAQEDHDELSRLHFGAPAPPTAGIDLEGRPLDLAEHRGQVVVLDFWTSFCQPCLALVPGTRALLDELAGEPLVWLGVCGDDDRLAGSATARRVGMSWRNLWDGPRGTEGPASTAWRVAARGWPSVFVIDAEGRIRAKLCGKEQVEAELATVLRGLLEERGN